MLTSQTRRFNRRRSALLRSRLMARPLAACLGAVLVVGFAFSVAACSNKDESPFADHKTIYYTGKDWVPKYKKTRVLANGKVVQGANPMGQ